MKYRIVTSENADDTTTRHRELVLVQESGGNTAAVGGHCSDGSVDFGLFQVTALQNGPFQQGVR